MGTNPHDFDEEIVWPYIAHPEMDRVDSYAFSSSVRRGPSFEQRDMLRAWPVFTTTNTYVMRGEHQYGAALVLLERVFDRYNRLLLPLWSERVFATSTISGATTYIKGGFATTRLVPGDRALVWFSEDEHYTVTVTGSTNDYLYFTEVVFPVAGQRKAIVMPLLSGRIDTESVATFEDSKQPTVSFTFIPANERTVVYPINVAISFGVGGADGQGDASIAANRALANALLDELSLYVGNPFLQINVRGICFWYIGGDQSVQHTVTDVQTPEGFDTLRAFFSAYPVAGFTYPYAGVTMSEDFFDDMPIGRNIMVLMTSPNTGTRFDDAVAAATDLLSKNTAPFGFQDGKSIDMFAVITDAEVNPDILQLCNVDETILLTNHEPSEYHLVHAIRDRIIGSLGRVGNFAKYMDSVDGVTVLPTEFVVVQSANESVSRARTAFVTQQGIDWYIDNEVVNKRDMMIQFEHNGAAEIQGFLNWIHTVKGRLKSFWLPYPVNHFYVVSDLIALNQITVKRAGLENPAWLVGKYLKFALRDGTSHYASVTDATLSSDTSYTMTMDVDFPSLLKKRDIVGIYAMEKFRLDTDTVELVHQNLWLSSTSAASTRVPDS